MKRTVKPKPPSETQQRFLDMVESGLSVADIVAATGKSRTHVLNSIKEAKRRLEDAATVDSFKGKPKSTTSLRTARKGTSVHPLTGNDPRVG